MKRLLSPGPSDYMTEKARPWNGPKYHFAKKYTNLDREESSPGPSDYNTNKLKFLKNMPKATIGNSPK